MAVHGTISAFDPSIESWSAYVERWSHYFVANDIATPEKKWAILLSACGPATYKLIRSLLPAGALDTTSYDDLVVLVKNYYELKPSPIVQRYKLNTLVGQPGESIARYVASL